MTQDLLHRTPSFMPGPYNYYCDHEGNGRVIGILDNSGCELASLRVPGGEPGEALTQLATAKLFLAAPGLFEAVRHVLKVAAHGGTFADIRWSMLKTAAAKALGDAHTFIGQITVIVEASNAAEASSQLCELARDLSDCAGVAFADHNGDAEDYSALERECAGSLSTGESQPTQERE